MADTPKPSADDATQDRGRVEPDEPAVRLTPGEKTIRLTPGEPTGHVPGERTLGLAAAAKLAAESAAEKPAANEPAYDRTILLRLPVIPGRPMPTEQPERPAPPPSVRSAVPPPWPPEAPGPTQAPVPVPAKATAKVPQPQARGAAQVAPPPTTAQAPAAAQPPAAAPPHASADQAPATAQAPAKGSARVPQPPNPAPQAPPTPPAKAAAQAPAPPAPAPQTRPTPPAKGAAKVPPSGAAPAAAPTAPAKASAQVPQAPARATAQVPQPPVAPAKPGPQSPQAPAAARPRPPAPAAPPAPARASAQVPPPPAKTSAQATPPAAKAGPQATPTAAKAGPQATPAAAKGSAQVALPAAKGSAQVAPPAAKAGAQVTPPAAKASAKVPPPTVKANAQVPVAKANAPSAPPKPPVKTGKPAEARPGEQTVVIRAPAMPAKRETAAEETMVIRLSTDTASKTATIAPVVIPGEADTKVLRPPMPSLVPPKPPRPLDALAPERERRTRPRPNGLGHAPWILALSSLGVVLVALGYAGGRYQTTYAIAAYWIGQVVVFTPVVLRLLSRRLAGVAESFILVLGLALNQYLLKWFYSPDQFRFPDELQHWLATTIINDTGELFQPNLALPPAVHFPGLAEMGAAVSQLTGLSVYDSGILVAGVAHLCFVGALFALVLRASGSPTIAGVSCVVYATTLHYLFFNSMYLYQTAALPFFMITVWAVRRWRAGGGWPFLAIAVVGIGLTTVSHHVTAVALVATVVLLGVTEFVAERTWPWRALLAPLIAVGMVAAWILLVARDVITYLEAPLDQVMKTASMFVTDHSDATTVTPAVSIWQLAVQGLGLIFLLVLFLALARDTLARHERDSWRWSILAGTAVFFVGNAVRFLGSNGPEIAGRLSTFTYVPISVVAAIALVHAVELIPRHRDAKGRRWLAVSPLPAAAPANRTFTPRVVTGGVIITVLMIGARVGGWPPPNQLLPGPYLAAGFERSVDELGISAARWQYETLGPGNRVGGDIVSVSLSSTYGRQDPVREVGALYYDGVWSGADDEMVTDLALSYLVVDSRLSEQLPTNQAYFESDPHAGRITEPLTKGQIGKFDTLPAVSRLYDNGTVRIYQMGES